MPTTEKDIFIYSAKESNPEICPVCLVGQLEYGALELLDSCVKYPWTCFSCNATGNEFANLIFDGHKVDTGSLPLGTKLAMEIKINVRYITVYDCGTEIRTSAILNLKTGEITDIKADDLQNDVGTLEREYIILNDAEIDVISDEDIPGYWVKLCSGHAGPCTDNYLAHREAISELSICDIVKAVEYINELAQYLDDKILDEKKTVLEPFEKVMKKLRTEELCRHNCGGCLYKSDLPQYDYVCAECDENF